MVPAAAARAAEVPVPGSAALPAPGPLAPPRPAPRSASGSLAAAGARLQRQRGPPRPRLCGCRSRRVLSRLRLLYKNCREEREADTISTLHLLDRGFPPSPPLSPSGSLPRSLLPLSLPPSARVSGFLGCHVTASPWRRGGERRGGDYSLQGRKFLGVCVPPPTPFLLSLQSGLGSCATSDLLGAPADFPLLHSHWQEEARLLLVLYVCVCVVFLVLVFFLI